ncbi:hypothetical protein [Kordia sp.]|uniref:hypothetical protein n=1 Tax=Kordia sp. TaxID=1965332 RepID=UPI003D2E6C41
MIKKILNTIKHGRITNIIKGGSNGSIVLLEIKSNEKQYILYIYCSWRLSIINKVLTGSNEDSTDINSRYNKEMNNLNGDVINNLIINNFGDFSINFKSKKTLDVFCDLTYYDNEGNSVENWTLCDVSENKCYNFTSNFNIENESYE